MAMDISQETLKQFCSYDPATGEFYRIAAMNWRHKSAVGKRCGCTNKATGYVTMHVGGRVHYAHRLAWIFVHGSIPEGARIDHANRNRSDNRISNLRVATQADNLRNCKRRVDNTSGIKGVSFDRKRQQWAAYVGRQKLGRFPTLLDAACARKAAALKAFGEFARE